MRRFIALSLVFAAAGVSASKKMPPPLETGHVVSQDISSQNGGSAAIPYGGAIISVPIRTASNTVVIDVGTVRYMWSEVGRKFVVLVVNSDVQFYRDGNWFIVTDTKGNKHKFSLTAARQKDPTETQ